MTKRDFFRLIIKLFGLYSLIITVFTIVPSQLAYLTLPFDMIYYVWVFGVLLLTAGIYILLIQKTDKVIDWLKIDRGFDDTQIVLGDFNEVKIIKLALIFIGGFLIIYNFPEFIERCYLAFKYSVSTDEIVHSQGYGDAFYSFSVNWGMSGINTLLGYIILANYKHIATWFEKKTSN